VLEQDLDARAAIADLARRARHERVEWQGRYVCWRGFGKGRPLVLIHGGHGNWLHWARNIDALAAEHAVWVVDMPGYGDSDEPAPGGGLPSLVDPLVATLDQLVGAQSPVDLAGFSFGGLVASHMACLRPQIRRLALLGPAGHGGRRRPRGELQPWKAAAEAGDGAALSINHLLLDWFGTPLET
jgi:pimeloyl-ACP methyl ester carboxylesterase